MELKFWKYEGTGNDFVLLDGRSGRSDIPGDVIRSLCNRNRGIGADGLMILCSEQGYDFRMKYFNADGGEVSMCGNGGRCITMFADHLGIGGDEKVFIGRDGEHRARIISRESGDNAIIEIGMVNVDSYEYSDNRFFLNTGVPHVIEFVDHIDQADITGLGRQIRNAERYQPHGGTNVDFVEVEGFGQIAIRTYERGVESETLSCGTGAVAAAIATHLFSQIDCNAFTVRTEGGVLDVHFEVNGRVFHNIRLSGPARRVFEGTINPKF